MKRARSFILPVLGAATMVLASQARAEGDDSRPINFAAKPVASAETRAAAPESATPARSASRGAERSAGISKPAAPAHLKARVAAHAAQQGVPFPLADAVVRIESRYNPRAANAGNFGLMQIRHQTARGVGYSGSAAGLLDAETNLRYGMAYLAQAYRMARGDTCGTVMRYQSGHMATRMSGANRAYCAKVRSLVARG